jgi:isocitrate dehydrogenase
MMLRHMGWRDAADLVVRGVSGAIHDRRVTEDFATHMENAALLGTVEFGQAVIECMQ